VSRPSLTGLTLRANPEDPCARARKSARDCKPLRDTCLGPFHLQTRDAMGGGGRGGTDRQSQNRRKPETRGKKLTRVCSAMVRCGCQSRPDATGNTHRPDKTRQTDNTDRQHGQPATQTDKTEDRHTTRTGNTDRQHTQTRQDKTDRQHRQTTRTASHTDRQDGRQTYNTDKQHRQSS
jgi:hypothetical protein